MNSSIYSIDEIKSLVTPVAQKYGIEQVKLFGSYARGEATADSDVDLLIQLATPVGIFQLAAIMDSFQEALGKSVDCLTVDSLSPDFRFSILNEEIALYAHL